MRLLILEGQIVNQPRLYGNNEDTGIELSTLGTFNSRGSLSHAANEDESSDGSAVAGTAL